jgi:hypothetical protein
MSDSSLETPSALAPELPIDDCASVEDNDNDSSDDDRSGGSSDGVDNEYHSQPIYSQQPELKGLFKRIAECRRDAHTAIGKFHQRSPILSQHFQQSVTRFRLAPRKVQSLAKGTMEMRSGGSQLSGKEEFLEPGAYLDETNSSLEEILNFDDEVPYPERMNIPSSGMSKCLDPIAFVKTVTVAAHQKMIYRMANISMSLYSVATAMSMIQASYNDIRINPDRKGAYSRDIVSIDLFWEIFTTFILVSVLNAKKHHLASGKT